MQPANEEGKGEGRIIYKEEIHEMVMTLFGIKVFPVCHSRGSECHVHLNKSKSTDAHFCSERQTNIKTSGNQICELIPLSQCCVCGKQH